MSDRNDILTSIIEVNHLLLRETDKGVLFQTICDILAENQRFECVRIYSLHHEMKYTCEVAVSDGSLGSV